MNNDTKNYGYKIFKRESIQTFSEKKKFFSSIKYTKATMVSETNDEMMKRISIKCRDVQIVNFQTIYVPARCDYDNKCYKWEEEIRVWFLENSNVEQLSMSDDE